MEVGDVGLGLLIGTCLIAVGVTCCVVRWFLRRGEPARRYGQARGHSVAAACVCTVLCLGTFGVVFVLLLALIAGTNDAAGDATIHSVQHLERWLRHTLRP